MTSQTVKLTQAQVATLAELLEGSHSGQAVLEQTQTETGGTHLYVTTGGKYWHIAAGTGNAQELDA